jgi:hypothetical protein
MRSDLEPMADEQERDPQSQPVAYSRAGYQLTAATWNNLTYQAWVEGEGHLWGRGTSMRARFGAVWVRKDAPSEVRIANGCMSQLPTFLTAEQ